MTDETNNNTTTTQPEQQAPPPPRSIPKSLFEDARESFRKTYTALSDNQIDDVLDASSLSREGSRKEKIGRLVDRACDLWRAAWREKTGFDPLDETAFEDFARRNELKELHAALHDIDEKLRSSALGSGHTDELLEARNRLAERISALQEQHREAEKNESFSPNGG